MDEKIKEALSKLEINVEISVDGYDDPQDYLTVTLSLDGEELTRDRVRLPEG